MISLKFEYIYFSYQDLAATEATASPSSVLFTPLCSTATLLPSGGEEEDVTGHGRWPVRGEDEQAQPTSEDMSGGGRPNIIKFSILSLRAIRDAMNGRQPNRVLSRPALEVTEEEASLSWGARKTLAQLWSRTAQTSTLSSIRLVPTLWPSVQAANRQTTPLDIFMSVRNIPPA